ncbi:MAG: 2-polyprenyl-3-methyl-6-methoxy-1,4-benzoquinone monooxygenase [Mariprofundaceae bacterium]|nr:2-polyprenyl-3-methyl-6-methoxy-1,4-benzoquinone monooxygenase [Mariprofundaceae bacterium]
MSTKTFRNNTLADHFIGHIDQALNNIFCRQVSQRPYPATNTAPDQLSDADKHKVAGLMRVNHAGEMAAQALYQGQSITARDPSIRDQLRHASIEESDHLNWCRTRLDELSAKPSKLDPLWYAGSFAIGVAAGIAGDRWNLGFLAATEHQVVRHLDSHLQNLPKHDERSRAIVSQMREDELGHATLAENLGAATLPKSINTVMGLTSKLMTSLAQRI